MESKQVEIGGETRPFRMGIRASSMICEKYNVDLSEFDKFMDEVQQKSKIDAIVYLVYAGLYAGYKKEKLPIDFDEEDVWVWVEDLMTDGGLEKVFGESGNEEAPKEAESLGSE